MGLLFTKEKSGIRKNIDNWQLNLCTEEENIYRDYDTFCFNFCAFYDIDLCILAVEYRSLTL
jgi:hypothetical protein